MSGNVNRNFLFITALISALIKSALQKAPSNTVFFKALRQKLGKRVTVRIFRSAEHDAEIV